MERNRWVNGNRVCKWFQNLSDFAGGHEKGIAIPLGELVVEENNVVVDAKTCYSHNQKVQGVDSFLRHTAVS